MLIMNIVLGIDNLVPKLWIQANFVPTLKFTQIFIKFSNHNNANYEHNTQPCVEHWRDYWHRMIIDSE